jgi:hypothetical protein
MSTFLSIAASSEATEGRIRIGDRAEHRAEGSARNKNQEIKGHRGCCRTLPLGK